MELNNKNYFNISDEVLREEIGSRTNKILLLKLKKEEYLNKLNDNKKLFDNIINEFNLIIQKRKKIIISING